MSSSGGKSFSYKTEYLPDGAQIARNAGPDGLITQTRFETNGGRSVTTPDGSVTSTKIGPDPRFGMRAPITTESVTTLPSGLASKVSFAREAVLGNPLDLTTLVTLKDSSTVNGKTATSSYDAAARTITSVSPEGRSSSMMIDSQGRPVTSSAPGLADGLIEACPTCPAARRSPRLSRTNG